MISKDCYKLLKVELWNKGKMKEMGIWLPFVYICMCDRSSKLNLKCKEKQNYHFLKFKINKNWRCFC